MLIFGYSWFLFSPSFCQNDARPTQWLIWARCAAGCVEQRVPRKGIAPTTKGCQTMQKRRCGDALGGGAAQQVPRRCLCSLKNIPAFHLCTALRSVFHSYSLVLFEICKINDCILSRLFDDMCFVGTYEFNFLTEMLHFLTDISLCLAIYGFLQIP